MIKYYENEDWLLEVSSDKISSNIIVYRKKRCLFWLRFGWLMKYISLEIFNKTLLSLNFKYKTKSN